MKKACAVVLNSMLLLTAFFLAATSVVQAHEVKSLGGANGTTLNAVAHQHVRASTGYGGTYRTGHEAKTGNSSIIIWSARQYNGYGSSQTRNKHYRGGFSKSKSGFGRSTNRQYGRAPSSRNQ